MADADLYSELLERCARGDEGALAQLYKLASPRLYGLCLRLLRQEALAEEVLQECFVKIWTHSARFSRQKGSGLTWMMSIVRNRALDIHRSLKTEPDFVDVEYEGLDFASDTPGPDDLAQHSEEARAIVRCLQELREDQRRCILLAFYQGHTHDELAAMLDTPLGTVKAWIRRGLERLRQCLA